MPNMRGWWSNVDSTGHISVHLSSTTDCLQYCHDASRWGECWVAESLTLPRNPCYGLLPYPTPLKGRSILDPFTVSLRRPGVIQDFSQSEDFSYSPWAGSGICNVEYRRICNEMVGVKFTWVRIFEWMFLGPQQSAWFPVASGTFKWHLKTWSIS